MAKTVVGMFDNFDEAQSVVQDLVNSGFDRNDISLVANDSRGHYQNFSREVGSTTDTAADKGAGTGAVGGSMIGGALGLLVGLGALAIPGIGPVIAAGPLSAAIGSTAAAVGMTAAGAGIGAAAGGLVGGLVGAGIPEEDANVYAEGVRRGGSLVMVNASDAAADTAVDIMNRHGAIDVDDRGSFYRNSGWNSFDTTAEPYSGEYTSDYHYSNRSSDAGQDWQDSSKVGTAGGTAAGAATGAAIGSAGGPVGTVIGGIAGAATGAGVGAAGDVAGEKAEDAVDDDDMSGSIDRSTLARGADLGTNAERGATTRMGSTGADASMGDINTRARRDVDATTNMRRDVDATTNTRSDVNRMRGEGEQVLPVVEEELRVGKRQVQRGGARIHTHVTETPVEEDVTLREERVNVERRPVNRPVSDADMAAFQEGTIEMTETAEEAIVDKQARVKEEVVISKDVHEHTETIHDTIRRTDVDVEHLGGDETLRSGGTSGMTSFDSFDNDFRTYYQTNYVNSGYTYDQYSPVFRYGYDLANDTRYQGDWTTVEPEARRYWEERNPGTWDRFKDSVRYAWERVRGRV